MGYARKSQISLKETPYYHCVSRCVRRGWLWGYDEYARKDYSHRKEWVIERLRFLSALFAIDLCAYAVMSNHYHTVLFVDLLRGKRWTEAEVVRRWGQLFKVKQWVKRYLDGEATLAERELAQQTIAKWRRRLMNISWYMRCTNEYLARRANAEDGCTGRFWEGRFKSQALLDEAGLLTAMAYVDLNPIRAGIAATPEESEFTSIYARIQALKGEQSNSPPLRQFHSLDQKQEDPLPCSLTDYFHLIEWTGRCIRKDKRGHIDDRLPPILVRLNIDAEAWTATMEPNGNVFGRAMGKLNHLQIHARALGQAWVKGLRKAERLYGSA
jgi:hypothetical protein